MVISTAKGAFFFLPLSAKVAVGTQRELLWPVVNATAKGAFFPLSAKVAVGTQRELEPLWLWFFPQPKVFFFLPLSTKVAVGTQRELKAPWQC